MPTIATKIEGPWVLVAEGPCAVTISAANWGVKYALTDGGAPALAAGLGHYVPHQSDRSLQLEDSEELWASGQGLLVSTVTEGE